MPVAMEVTVAIFIFARIMSQDLLLSDPGQFSDRLLGWYAGSHRPLPWKEARSPYVVWLSEVILQQTRVEQGLPYFRHFLDRFPTVEALADASPEEVMKCWEGLGYYSRARNLHATARHVAYALNGRFPETYEEILALKGIGPYTAAAIASFAFNLPEAVVDGNVFRVLSRVFGIAQSIDSGPGKAFFNRLARQLIDSSQPGRYNQAIMDFGATRCTPKNPKCAGCPFEDICAARLSGRVSMFPVRGKKPEKRQRFFHYLVLRHENALFLRQRTEKDIWQQLFEFPLIELSEAVTDPGRLAGHPLWEQATAGGAYHIEQVSPPFRQTLTHQLITAVFLSVRLDHSPDYQRHGWLKIQQESLGGFAFPKIIDLYLRDKALYLNLL